MGVIRADVWTIKGYFEAYRRLAGRSSGTGWRDPWQAFRLVLLPLSVPILAVVFILSFIAAITEVPVASLLLRDVRTATPWRSVCSSISAQNYLWGDFATAAVLSAIPITP